MSIPQHHRLAACFFLFSLITGAMYSRLPDIQLALGVNEAQLGLTLIGAAIGSLISLTLSSPLIERLGARTTGFITVLGSTACYASITLVSNAVLAFAILFVAGLLAGALEINLNVQIGRLEALYKRSLMSRAHGFWSLGFFVTSLIAAGIRQAGVPAGCSQSCWQSGSSRWPGSRTRQCRRRTTLTSRRSSPSRRWRWSRSA